MIAYKFLRTGRVGPFSGFRWPGPGHWVRVPGTVDACRRGIHACRVRDLPWWLGEELWEIELDGDVQPDEHKVIARAGRLRSQIEAWTPACAIEYGEACAWRARDHAVRALRSAGHEEPALRLATCETLEAARQLARGLSKQLPDNRITLTIARDGAFRALTGAAPTSAYIAAHAAKRLDGPAGYDAERAWQSRWLTERLGLREGA
jgi:hypothetical protein